MDETFGIGAVVAALADEFPDVSVSKIRYWETAGIITPDRAPSGFRRYGQRDVERLRFAMSAQRDRYLPLKVIREQLDALDRGFVSTPDEPSPSIPVAGTVSPDAFRASAKPLRLTKAEVVEASGISVPVLDQLMSYGLVVPSADGFFDSDGLAIADAARQLSDMGLEVRHLRTFKVAADREVDLIDGALEPIRRAGTSSRLAGAVRDTAAATVTLHTALVRAGLKRAGL